MPIPIFVLFRMALPLEVGYPLSKVGFHYILSVVLSFHGGALPKRRYSLAKNESVLTAAQRLTGSCSLLRFESDQRNGKNERSCGNRKGGSWAALGCGA
jgi:hypothetical protein